MLDILLQQIRDLISKWFTDFTTHAQHVENKLDSIDQTASDIKTDADNLPDIKDNTAAVITPINNIKTNTDSIVTSSGTTATNTTAIMNQMSTVSTNTCRAAAFSEDCANNTLNILDKVTTIASDTTQIRTDSDSMVTEQSKIYDAVKWLLSDKYIETTESGASPFEFETDVADDLISCKVGIAATQSGSGDPTPDNVRTISGYSSMGLTVNGSSITITLGDTYYFGDLDVISGDLVITSKGFAINNKIWGYSSQYGFMSINMADMKTPDNANPLEGLICEVYTTRRASAAGSNPVNYSIVGASPNSIRILDTNFTDATSFTNTMGNYKIVYPLAAPQTISLTAQQIAAIKGVNTIVTDTNGNIEVTYKESIKNYLDKLDNA